MNKLPLSGYRVLDLTAVTAGPVGTMMLADIGADVVKVEEYAGGDLSRNMGTLYVAGESSNFLSQNRNKRSVRLDLKKPEGNAVFLKMAEQADVIVENFRPGVVNRLGIDYDTVRARNPRIVYASISAYGQTGPYAHLPANDPCIQALTGLMAMTGEADGEPVRVGSPAPDFNAAALMCFSVCAALLHRERTGEGQRLDLSLMGGTIISMLPRDGETLRLKRPLGRFGSGHPAFVPYRNYKSKEGSYFFLSCFTEKFWTSLCDAIERPDLKSDARFLNNVNRNKNRALVDGELEAIFSRFTLAELMARFEKHNVPAAPVQDLYTALTSDPQVAHNKTVISLEHPTAGTVEMIAHPVNYHKTPAQYRAPAPRLGEHTFEVLQELSFDRAEIERLEKLGVLAGIETEDNQKRAAVK
ncbi:CoA transferase [Bradyrhizobium sp. dw_78]|uniref:CaiB/BaiF CoA transferase family protein n=1 Tax=Bradyrhizobium sp. dw_78 TaxID=2719793 RepID=UPI001BD522E6